MLTDASARTNQGSWCRNIVVGPLSQICFCPLPPAASEIEVERAEFYTFIALLSVSVNVKLDSYVHKLVSFAIMEVFAAKVCPLIPTCLKIWDT